MTGFPAACRWVHFANRFPLQFRIGFTSTQAFVPALHSIPPTNACQESMNMLSESGE